MPLKSHEARKLAMASVAALAVLGASASSASAAKLTLTYQCTYPLIGEAPLKIDIDAAIPASTPKGVPTANFKIDTIATASGNTYTGISLIGAKKLEGSAVAKSTVALPGGINLPVSVPITVAPYDVPATAQDLVLSASGETPSLTFPTAGTAKITVDSIALSLKAIKADGTAVIFPGSDTDSDKDINTFDVTCRLDPATQDTTLANITITGDDPIPVDNPPSAPGAVTASGITNTGATLSWGAATDDKGVAGYVVSNGATQLAAPTGTSTTLAGLAANTSYTLTVKAKDTAGQFGPTSSVTFKTTGGGGGTTPPVTPNTTPNGGVNYAYNIGGSATLKTLVKGTLPLSGSIAANLDLATSNFTGDLALNQATGKLTALGFLPVVAKVNIVPTQKVSGSLKDGVLNANAVVRIKLPSVTLFGIQLAGGANCQAAKPSNIALKSTDAFFNPLQGGTLAGTFAISDLTGCGFLNGIVSPLTAGKGNAIALKLTPKS